MIYTVECAFTDPAREAGWNAWYDQEKLPDLLSLPGFRASQRFRAVTASPSPYLAIHSVRDAGVLDRPDYRDVGGGTFCGWDELVTGWARNLYTGLEAAPEVSPAEYLVMLDDPAAAGTVPETDFAWLDIAGLDRTVARRGLAVVDRATGTALAREAAGHMSVFAPLGPRQVSPHGIDG